MREHIVSQEPAAGLVAAFVQLEATRLRAVAQILLARSVLQALSTKTVHRTLANCALQDPIAFWDAPFRAAMENADLEASLL